MLTELNPTFENWAMSVLLGFALKALPGGPVGVQLVGVLQFEFAAVPCQRKVPWAKAGVATSSSPTAASTATAASRFQQVLGITNMRSTPIRLRAKAAGRLGSCQANSIGRPFIDASRFPGKTVARPKTRGPCGTASPTPYVGIREPGTVNAAGRYAGPGPTQVTSIAAAYEEGRATSALGAGEAGLGVTAGVQSRAGVAWSGKASIGLAP